MSRIPTKRAVFLIGDTTLARHDNHHRLPAALRAAGWQVDLLAQESVRLDGSGVCFGGADPSRYDLIWLLGMGRAHTFLDRMQLLRLLPPRRFVVEIDALLHRHAKYPWWRWMPETHASGDLDYLGRVLAGGGDWVAKPAAGSYGRDVERIRDDAEGRAVLARLTGQGRGDYCILQRFVPAIAQGEKRTLVAGGRIIGSYLRVPGDALRANLGAGGSARPTALSDAERELVEGVAEALCCAGIGFAAVDTVFPYLMEVNLANPGGLATLTALYGGDPAAEAVAAVCAWRGLGPGPAR